MGAVLGAACDDAAPSTVSDDSSVASVVGYRGGIRTAVGFELLEGTRAEYWSWYLTEESSDSAEAAVSFSMELLESNCEDFPAFLSCPARDDAVVSYRLSVLLDFHQRLELQDASGDADLLELVYTGPERQDDTIGVILPTLQAGEHCLLIAALEDDAAIVGGQFSDHSNTALFVISVGERGASGCDADPLRGPWWPVDSAGSVGDCGLPFLTENPGLYAREVPASSQALWAVLPRCGENTDQSVVVFAINGILQGEDDLLAPFKLPEFEGTGIVVPVAQPGDSVRVMIVDHQSLVPTSVRHSRPALN